MAANIDSFAKLFTKVQSVFPKAVETKDDLALEKAFKGIKMR